MKKAAITLLLVVAAVCAKGQTMYDALTFSEKDYEGTARTMAMGNAFTALGGDLGSVTINPAGSAVARYSQFTISPGVSISVDRATGTSSDYFGRNYKNSFARFDMPNIGFTINFDTHRTSGIKNWTFGVVANKTANYTDDVYAKGLNYSTSISGSMATYANGYSLSDLGSYYSGSDLDAVLAYQSGIISYIDGDGYENEYVGVAENIFSDGSIATPGALNQTYGKRTTGYKYDYVINFGGNVNDRFYFGANLGIIALEYDQEYYIRESSGGSAVDYSYFDTEFSDLKYSNKYSADGIGVYGKFGFILTPAGGLRIGAAIQTPSMMKVTERWRSSGYSNYSTYYSDTTPEMEYSYRLISPMSFNVGLAYAFMSMAVVSVDYEMCDYSSMRFKMDGSNDNSDFDYVNDDIKDMMGISHSFRAGVEFKPVSSFAVRLGYGITTAPDKENYRDLSSGELSYYSDFISNSDYSFKYQNSNKQKYSIGFGYSSKGSLFADFALQCTTYDQYIYPYFYYNGLASSGRPAWDVTANTPVIKSERRLWNAIVTLGLRF